jgi:hypothetical protein
MLPRALGDRALAVSALAAGDDEGRSQTPARTPSRHIGQRSGADGRDRGRPDRAPLGDGRARAAPRRRLGARGLVPLARARVADVHDRLGPWRRPAPAPTHSPSASARHPASVASAALARPARVDVSAQTPAAAAPPRPQSSAPTDLRS